MTILDAITDHNLFRPLFKSFDSWRAWLTVLRAIFALPMPEDDLPIFQQLTGRKAPPVHPVQECWLVVGRRGGKSFIVALIAVFLACFRDYRHLLGPGERGVLMIIATDRKQARVIMRYIAALLNHVPMLKHMVVRQDTESVDLDNMVSIEITTASYRTIRGYTVVAALCDEIAFWRSEESANPAEEILSALRPAMSTIPGALLIGLGTPYKRSGPLYDSYRRHYGQTESPVLVVQADTRTMNPTVSPSVIDRAMEIDPVAAHAEYLAVFRSDVGGFMDAELIERAIEPGRRERTPVSGIHYQAFVDPSPKVCPHRKDETTVHFDTDCIEIAVRMAGCCSTSMLRRSNGGATPTSCCNYLQGHYAVRWRGRPFLYGTAASTQRLLVA